MSDDVLKIIPADRNHVPDPKRHKNAVSLLEEMFPDGEMCEAQSFEELQFIDAGENVDAIKCPACGARLPLEDDPAFTWWYETLDRVADASVEKLQTTMPCCKATVPFTSLEFDWPAGFARFELSIWNPNIARDLTEPEMAKLEVALGCKLKQVRAHY